MSYQTHYQMLFVDPCADIEIISRVYRLLAKRHHPDQDAASGAAARMSKLSDAFDVISDPQRRAAYDRSIGVSCASGRGSRVTSEVQAVAIDTNPVDGSGPATEVSPTTGLSLAEEHAPYGDAGPPPAYPPPRGMAMSFGRYRGWTLAQIDVRDRNYLEWLRRTPNGRTYAAELDRILSQAIPA